MAVSVADGLAAKILLRGTVNQLCDTFKSGARSGHLFLPGRCR
jgi:hypothetical protein